MLACYDTRMKCKYCGQKIPALRLEAIPGVATCIDCSDEKPTVGFMMYSHKTAGEVQMIRNCTAEQRHMAEKEYLRER